MGKEKKVMGERLKKNILPILIVSFSGAIIYGLPYFRLDYYDTYLEMFHLTNSQMGYFGSIYGLFGMISYLFGGYVADKISVKKLISASLIGTGIGGFIHLLPLNFTMLLILYGFWGVTSLFAFWPSCVKAVRMMADSKDQGKAFGIFEGGRGISAAIVSTIAVFIFTLGSKKLGAELGVRWLIIFYAVTCIIIGILVLFFMKDGTIESEEKMNFSDIKHVLKIPAVWLISFVTLATYMYTMSFYYFTPYSTAFLGASVTLGAVIASARRYISPVSNTGGGFLADKFGTTNLLFISFLIMAGSIAAMLALPTEAKMLSLFIVFYIISYFFYNVNYALGWAMMEEGNIPVNYSGTAVGVISTIGYLPEVFTPVLAGKLIDGNNGSALGYRYFFIIVICVLLLGAMLVLLWKKYLKRLRASTVNK